MSMPKCHKAGTESRIGWVDFTECGGRLLFLATGWIFQRSSAKVSFRIYSQLNVFELSSRFCAVRSFLVFSQKKRVWNGWFWFLTQWSGTEVNCASLALPLLFLTASWEVFCKYPMQLHWKQSTGLLSTSMCLITTHSQKGALWEA